MNKTRLKFLFGLMACSLLIVVSVSFAQQTEQSGTQAQEPQAAQGTKAQAQETKGELPPPLEAQMVVAEHWSKNPYPKTVEAGNRVHIVERGDTLWDLAQRYYNNPFLWPQIWDANKYVPNAHWIYPGDPIVIPPLSPMSEEKIAQETATEPQTGEKGEEETAPAPAQGKRAYPIALASDLYCSGFITNNTSNWTSQIIGNEMDADRVGQSLYDIVYINAGEAEGVSPGDEFTTMIKRRSIEHPITLKTLGDYVVQTGRIKVVATQEHTSTAQVTYSCQPVEIGNYLVPFEPKEVPLLSDMPTVDRFGEEGPNAKGYIVHAKYDLGTVAEGYEVEVDLGAKDGVVPGTRMIIYREHFKTYEETKVTQKLPRRVLGELVVFNVQDTTATGRIIQMYDYAQVGDQVEVR